MKPIKDLFTDIAREHLGIETLETRHRDWLDFHNVSVWGVRNALKKAFDAGANAASKPSRKMQAALKAFLEADELAEECGEWKWENLDHAFRLARSAIAEAEAAGNPSGPVATDTPIVTVEVRGGLIEDMDATSPVHVVVEDWDIPDYDTDKKPARSVWELDASLTGPKAEKLRRLIAND
jgi:hypothetical protein